MQLQCFEIEPAATLRYAEMGITVKLYVNKGLSKDFALTLSDLVSYVE